MSEKSERSSGSGGGIGFFGALQIAFIVLKLCGVIDWKWSIVLMPAWVCAILLAVVFLLAYIMVKLEKRESR